MIAQTKQEISASGKPWYWMLYEGMFYLVQIPYSKNKCINHQASANNHLAIFSKCQLQKHSTYSTVYSIYAEAN